MRQRPRKSLALHDGRRLRRLPPEGTAPVVSIPQASFFLTGAAPPRVTTELRPFGEGRNRAWQVAVNVISGASASPAEPPRFIKSRLRLPPGASRRRTIWREPPIPGRLTAFAAPTRRHPESFLGRSSSPYVFPTSRTGRTLGRRLATHQGA